MNNEYTEQIFFRFHQKPDKQNYGVQAIIADQYIFYVGWSNACGSREPTFT